MTTITRAIASLRMVAKLKRMAAKIVKDQGKEIREMKGWLNKHK